MAKLGVNIDHVATLREARREDFPDPVEAALICERSGCDSIVCHLREDRRHIKDMDVVRLRKAVKTRLNLEMSIAKEIADIAVRIKPDQATLVPEKRQEVTTEGGLDVVKNEAGVRRVVGKLKSRGIAVSLFINPAKAQIDASMRVGADMIELHTGVYANAKTAVSRRKMLDKLVQASEYASRLGLEVNAGHGLDYKNVRDVAAIKGMNELNIGYAIIARAVFAGLESAVKDMIRMIK